MTKRMQKQIEAAELWFYRRMMKIPWTKRITNEEVLQLVNKNRRMMTTIRRQLQFMGHVTTEDGLEKLRIEGKVDGKKGRGRPRQNYMAGLTLVTGMDSSILLHKAENRSGFRRLVANVRV